MVVLSRIREKMYTRLKKREGVLTKINTELKGNIETSNRLIFLVA